MNPRSISVIMPSFLGPYKGAASDRRNKFLRSVKSFVSQSFNGDKELIIISDGCEDTKRLYQTFYRDSKEIKLISMPKQPTFSGAVREKGLRAAQYNLIAYLDTDDIFNVSHIDVLVHQTLMMQKDWVFFSDWIKKNKRDSVMRNVELVEGQAGTSCICHKRELPVSWQGLDGYGHDWKFICRLKEASNNYIKIHGAGYTVCHTVNGVDL